MAFQIINSIISWFLRKRKHQIDLFLKYPIDVQHELLLELVYTAKNTEFGKEKNFAIIKNHEDFAANVPIQKYETFEPLIERCRKGEQNLFWPSDIKWFAKSSGTTNAKSKFIPVSDDALEYCHLKAGKDMLCWYVHDNEDAQLFTGKG
ncbi:MAG: protein-disulfide isomerase, partial [Polaribacter sp.]